MGLLLFLNEFIDILNFFLRYNMANIDTYDLHKQKFFGILNNF